MAILARGAKPVLTRASLPGDPVDKQARYIEAAVGGVLIAWIYLPNGNPQPGPKFVYKLAWFERLIAHAATLIEAGVPAVLAGDYNVVSDGGGHLLGTLPCRKRVDPAGKPRRVSTAARSGLDRRSCSIFTPTSPPWTFWSYERGRRAAGKGMRLDHLLVSPHLMDRLNGGGVDEWVRDQENASDHAPAWVDIAF